MQDVYLLTDDETRHVYGSLETTREGQVGSRVPIGTYTGPRSVACLADIDKMFSQHCAILGSTGFRKVVSCCSHLTVGTGAQNWERRVATKDCPN